MIELIQEIILAEREADEAIQKAKETAASEKRSAEEVIQSRIAETREQAKSAAKARIEEARGRLGIEHTSGPDVVTDAKRYIDEHAQMIETLIKDITHTILKTELDQS
jgi:vacuolar-type H+-ATPase subunit H